jgi:rhodanese-related sulfurtransferase
MEKRAVLIDIRDADEHAREHIPGARLLPLTKIAQGGSAEADGAPALFTIAALARAQPPMQQRLNQLPDANRLPWKEVSRPGAKLVRRS